MTKKTNSLLFRFGVSTLWKNKCVSGINLATKLRVENIITKELFKNKLEVVTIFYRFKAIIVFIFYQYESSDKFKRVVLNYYNKTLSVFKTIEKFGLSYIAVLQVIKKHRVKKIIFLNKVSTMKFFLLNSLFYKNFFILQFFFKWLRSFTVSYFHKFLLFFKILSNFYFNFSKKFKVKKLRRYYKKQNRKIFGLTSIKIFALQLENLILKFYNCYLFIKIQHVFLLKGGFLQPLKGFVNTYKKYEFRWIFMLLYLASNYNQSKLLSDYLSKLIKGSKKHFRNLSFFVKALEFVFNWNLIQILGFQLRLNGKLGGKLRKSKYHYKLGKVQLQTLRFNLSYSFSVSYTKFGTISIKVWLLNGNTLI